ncbi:MAG: hypothetical protein ACE5HL_08740 [Terriglobia bacterium]
MGKRHLSWVLGLTLLAVLPLGAAEALWQPLNSLDDLARNYVLLVLRLDKHIAGFNDYYYGPPEWKQRVEAEEKIPVGELRREVAAWLAALNGVKGPAARRGWFRKQLMALDANLRQLQGEKLSVAEQARLLYDLEVIPPPSEELEAARDKLERLLPGPGPLAERLQAWREKFHLSEDQLPKAYRLALEVTRERTHALLLLPPDEEVELYFVKNKSWSAYNWFQGNAHSRIEVNTDLPARATHIFAFAAHEAYPGHHTDLTTREQRLYGERGYLEWCVSPLFTPASTMAEAAAQVGAEIVLSREERLAWHRNVFFPALGLTGVDVELWLKVEEVLGTLGRARERVPFMLFDEGKSEEEIVVFLQQYALMSPERARKAVAFSRAWGAYTFNYTVGREILRRYLATGNARAKFVQLLTTPIYPSLVKEWIRTGAEP